MLVKKFKHTIFHHDTEIEFSFHPMNVRQLDLFQVYVNWEGRQLRFHMQLIDKIFKITDAEKLPNGIRMLQEQLAEAIIMIHPS